MAALAKTEDETTKAKSAICDYFNHNYKNIDRTCRFHILRVEETKDGKITGSFTGFTPMTGVSALGLSEEIAGNEEINYIILAEYKKEGQAGVFSARFYLSEDDNGDLSAFTP